MSHLGQRLSALIDGELDLAERERVLMHLAKCRSCCDEIAALHTLKRRMNALGDAAADSGLTGRLIGLPGAVATDDDVAPRSAWPESAEGWLSPGSQARMGRYVLAASLAAVLAGLGTAAFIAGGPQAHAPEPAITPSVDVYTVQHDLDTGWAPANPPLRSASLARTSHRLP